MFVCLLDLRFGPDEVPAEIIKYSLNEYIYENDMRKSRRPGIPWLLGFLFLVQKLSVI